MLKHVLKSAACAVGAVVATATLGSGAAFADDIVPSGCVGSVYYACTGAATPGDPFLLMNVPVVITIPGTPLVPGQEVGGQHIGGVVVPVGGETIPGSTVSVGGPVPPTDTGVLLPVGICAFVTCLPAGAPVVVPGIPLPVVPVTVPPVSVPAQSVGVPEVGTVPTTSTPPLVLPAFEQGVGTLHVYGSRQETVVQPAPYLAADLVCAVGGGTRLEYRNGSGSWWYCENSPLGQEANLLYYIGGPHT
jgi:hypothetical protein